MALLTVIPPVLVLTPTRTTPAVIRPSSVSVRPSVPAASAPPRLMICAVVDGAIVTMPEPALIACWMSRLSAVILMLLLVAVDRVCRSDSPGPPPDHVVVPGLGWPRMDDRCACRWRQRKVPGLAHHTEHVGEQSGFDDFA